jgi:hypothetical protein
MLTWRMTRRNAAGVYAVFGSSVCLYLQIVERACEDCKILLTNEVGYVSEIMCDCADERLIMIFYYLLVVFLEKLVVYF